MKTIITKNEKETLAFARRIARELQGGEVLLLQGELGAGKTTFVRGLARALGITTRIKSPTFTLLNLHTIPVHATMRSRKRNARASRLRHFAHADAYRVKNARALEAIGLMDYINRRDTVCVIEWGEKIKPLLRGRRYTLIKFRHGKKENERAIRVTPQH